MKSSAVLTIDGIFNLPDDFNGTHRDALKLYLEYLMSKEHNDKNKKLELKDMKDADPPCPVDIYKTLWESDNAKTVYGISVMRYTEGEWKVLQEERV